MSHLLDRLTFFNRVADEISFGSSGHAPAATFTDDGASRPKP